MSRSIRSTQLEPAPPRPFRDGISPRPYWARACLASSAGVFEIRQRFQAVLRGAGQHEFALVRIGLQLIVFDRDQLRAYAEKSTHRQHCDRLMGAGLADDEVVDLPDRLILLVDDGTADDFRGAVSAAEV